MAASTMPHCDHATDTRYLVSTHVQTALNSWSYKLFRRGPYATPLTQALAFIRSSSDLTVPDIQLRFVPAGTNRTINANSGYPPKLHSRIPHACTTFAYLLHPQSRGTIELVSADALHAPKIDPQYLSNPNDLEVLVAAFKVWHQRSA
jgi:choline dehydrogenase-like flavoprotein